MQPIWRSLLYRPILTSLLLLAARADTAHAQDCGEYCGPCGTGRKEGYFYSATGDYYMACLATTGGCSTTGCGETLVSDVPEAVADLLAVVRSGSVGSLSAMLGAARERLLVYPPRNLVAVLGERCAANKIVAVVFLPPARVAALAKSGLPRLESFVGAGEKSQSQRFVSRSGF